MLHTLYTDNILVAWTTPVIETGDTSSDLKQCQGRRFRGVGSVFDEYVCNGEGETTAGNEFLIKSIVFYLLMLLVVANKNG